MVDLESKDVPPLWRPAWTLIVFIVAVGGSTVLAYVGVDSHIEKAAETAVAKKWTEVYQAEALKACTSAAEQGAFKAMSEAMQQVVLPMQSQIAALSKDVEGHRREDDTRVADLSRRVTRLEDHRRIP